jgi:hypothetical protein
LELLILLKSLILYLTQERSLDINENYEAY